MESFDLVAVPPRLYAPVRAALRGEPAVWPALTEQESRALALHGVAPLIYAVEPLPALRGEAIRAAALEPARAADLREVLAALASRGIEPLLMKGSALAYEIYAAPELRPRADVDLLVAPDAVATLREAMRAIGFAERVTSGDELGVRQAMLTRKDAHGIGHAYDVHWGVANPALFSGAFDYADLRSRAVAVPRLGPHALGLCRVDALLLACVHRVAHHHDSDRLIWLVDIALLADAMSEDEWARFWRLAADARMIGVCERSIALADEWMSRAPRSPAGRWVTDEELTRHEPSRAFLDRGITYGGIMAANFRALPWRARIRRLRQLAFPPASYMRQEYRRHATLALPWLYVHRAFRGVARLFRRVRA